jgi:pimeloyl-ACP methyl ester carboxylesterase
MPGVEANGVRLYYELHGEGPPLALVHGSWGDASNWQRAVRPVLLLLDGSGSARRSRLSVVAPPAPVI